MIFEKYRLLCTGDQAIIFNWFLINQCF